MVLIDELLHIPNAHRRTTDIVDLRSVLLSFLFLRLKPLLVGDEVPPSRAVNGSKREEMGNGAKGMGEEKSLEIMVLNGSNSQIEMEKEERGGWRKRDFTDVKVWAIVTANFFVVLGLSVGRFLRLFELLLETWVFWWGHKVFWWEEKKF
ncbi:hypothetical protein M0R45_005649 [Rubus argutus]|uniref:Uncharacterized protein n=1 Tax=Rubus argutus TaxID=59490 RepID=A0AAW1YNA3_RUBAR